MNLKWLLGETDIAGDIKLNHATACYNFGTDLTPAVGIDPGRNFGVAFLLPHPLDPAQGLTLTTYWGRFPLSDYHPEYFNAVKKFLYAWLPPKCPAKVCMIEGPAYSARYSQPLLEDVRLGFYISFQELGYEVYYVSPTAARKAVFGNGRRKASQIWVNINGNAADAAAIALYAGGFRKEIE